MQTPALLHMVRCEWSISGVTSNLVSEPTVSYNAKCLVGEVMSNLSFIAWQMWHTSKCIRVET
ncbi:hypothetical protein RSAG8_12497, partial [Rhizoctonia solani AG-8 WAC10335]